MQQWDWPGKPWIRLHIDHAGPYRGKTFLMVVDAHSKWIEVSVVPSTSAAVTIDKLRHMFATHGLPEVLVSDNGTGFTNTEFKEFLKRNGIEHRTTTPYHTSSNGLAERAVQTLKDGLRKMKGPIEIRLDRFLMKYRLTPHATTGKAPAELLMGRRIRSHMDLLHPTTAQRVRSQQMAQQQSKGGRPRVESLQVGERVMARDFSTDGRKWLFGKVIEKLGEAMVKVELDDGRIWRHLDHVTRSQISSGIPVPELTNGPDDDDTGPSEQSPPEQPPPDPSTSTEPVIDLPVMEQDQGRTQDF